MRLAVKVCSGHPSGEDQRASFNIGTRRRLNETHTQYRYVLARVYSHVFSSDRARTPCFDPSVERPIYSYCTQPMHDPVVEMYCESQQVSIRRFNHNLTLFVMLPLIDAINIILPGVPNLAI